MKLVLDYIYSGAMYLCGAHMQYVIQVEPYLSLPKSEKTLKTYIVYIGDRGLATEVWYVCEQDGKGF